MKVIIETLGNQIVSDYCFKGWLGAINEGHDVELLSLPAASMKQDKLKQEKPMPIGSVGYMEYFFDLYGVQKPFPLIDFNLERSWTVTRRDQLNYPVFVKPLVQIKKFTGAVFTNAKQWDLYPELEDWDGPYLCKEPFELPILSEWRVFVHNGKIKNISYYSGTNPRAFPDRWTIGFILEHAYNPPAAFTMDVCVLEDGSTRLVEFNDMWAIGPYGCNENDYFSMLKDRWNEIINGEK